METAGRIPPQPWMSQPASRSVLAALAADGAPARFVGGCVRDAVLGRPVKDIDVATPEPPERVIALLRAAGIKVVPTGLDHGTVTAIEDGAVFEVTTLRRDVETDGRRAVVAFTDDWKADAARRDFTMNALFCDADGTLYDPAGGLADLEAGRVRFVGSARERIAEDVLRLLRFFRFHAWYGSGRPDAEAMAACREMAPRLAGLSAERVWAELSRTLLAPDPAAVLALMAEAGALAWVLPEAARLDRLTELVALEAELSAEPAAIRRLAAAIDIAVKAVPALADRLRMSRRERQRLADAIRHRAEIGPDLDDAAAGRALYRWGADAFADAILLAWAEARLAGGRRQARWRLLWKRLGTWSAPRFPLSGHDALELGLVRGPHVGRLLRAVEDWWIDQSFRPDRAACIAHLAALAAGESPDRPARV